MAPMWQDSGRVIIISHFPEKRGFQLDEGGLWRGGNKSIQLVILGHLFNTPSCLMETCVLASPHGLNGLINREMRDLLRTLGSAWDRTERDIFSWSTTHHTAYYTPPTVHPHMSSSGMYMCCCCCCCCCCCTMRILQGRQHNLLSSD